MRLSLSRKIRVGGRRRQRIGSKKKPDGTRIMAYKLMDVSDAEAFQEDCANFVGFASDFEAL